MSPLSGHGGSWLRGGQRRLRRAARAAHAAAGLGRLCASPLGRLKVFAAAASVAAGRRVPGWPAEAELPLRLGSRSHPVVVGDLSELEALYEVLVEDEYRLPPALDPRVVLDLGSHVGASVIALKLTYPSARVIAVEPDPHSFARLTRNVSSLEGVTCLNVAAGAQPGRRRLFRQEGSSWSSSLLAEQNLDCAEEVEVWSLAQILARADVEAVELVKFDVEGAEWELFPAFARLEGVLLLAGEIHFREAGPRDFEVLHEVLPGFEIDVLRSDKYGGVVHARRPPAPA